MPPLPAAEVRRRGDRRRRRQTVLAGLGAASSSPWSSSRSRCSALATTAARPAAGTRADLAAPFAGPAGRDVDVEGAAPEPHRRRHHRGAPRHPPRRHPRRRRPARALPTSPCSAPSRWPPGGPRPAVTTPSSDPAAGSSRSPTRRAAPRLAYPDVVDRLRTRLSGPEDNRTRQLFVFDDAQARSPTSTPCVDFYEGCPQESVGSGITCCHRGQGLALGGQSLAVVRSYAGPDGAPTIGLDDVVVVRLGRSVLIDTVANEAVAIERRIRDQLRAAERPPSAPWSPPCARSPRPAAEGADIPPYAGMSDLLGLCNSPEGRAEAQKVPSADPQHARRPAGALRRAVVRAGAAGTSCCRVRGPAGSPASARRSRTASCRP